MSLYRSTDMIQRETLAVLAEHVGRGRAIQRAGLLSELRRRLGGLSDRKMRDALYELSMSDGPGALVCSAQDGAGYFIAESPEEMAAHLRKEIARTASLGRRIAAQRKAARQFFAGLGGKPVRQLNLWD